MADYVARRGWMLVCWLLFGLLGACGGAGSVEAPDSVAEPVCLATSYEAGAQHACGDGAGNPVVLECDRTPTPAAMVRAGLTDGEGWTCQSSAMVNTVCCEQK